MNNIDQIMCLIDWSRSEEDQAKGISMAQEVTCIKAFFQPIGPGYSKNVWDNCALIVSSHSDEELNPYVLDMLLWLEDLNWPGAEIIQQRLCRFNNVDWLVNTLDRLVPALNTLGKDSWLGFLSELISNEQIREKVNCDTLNILSKHVTPR